MRMFAGKRPDESLCEYSVAPMAAQVRARISDAFVTHIEHDQGVDGWARAKKAGWRVVPVQVTEIRR